MPKLFKVDDNQDVAPDERDTVSLTLVGCAVVPDPDVEPEGSPMPGDSPPPLTELTGDEPCPPRAATILLYHDCTPAA